MDMEKKQIKAKDLAQMLNMSTASISFVLNGKPGVSEKNRKLILDKIKELGCEYLLKIPPKDYSSSAETETTDRTLANEVSNQTLNPPVSETAPQFTEVPETFKTIGFVVYKRFGTLVEESPFFKYMIEGINLKLKMQGYDMKFIYINKNDFYQFSLNTMMNSQCEGFIIFGVEMKEDDLDVFIQSGLPFVLLDNSFQTIDVDCVAINNQQGISKAVSYLYEKGHRNIGYIKSIFDITSFKERFDEYRIMLEQLDLPYNPDHVINVGYSEKEVETAISAYLKQNRPASAFIADNDLLGCFALNSFQRMGYRVPDDVSIIGFDNRPICQWVNPSLTTIAVPQDIFGPSAAQILLEKIKAPRHQSLKMQVGVSLIERGSVADLNSNL